MAALVAAFTLSCGDGAVAPAWKVESVMASRDTVVLEVNQATQLRAEAMDGSSRLVTGRVAWESSNSSVVRIDTLGIVTAVGAGSATITASLLNRTDVIQFIVPEPIIRTLLASHLDTIPTIPGELRVPISTSTASGPRAGALSVGYSGHWIVSAAIEDETSTLVITALEPGEVWVHVTERNGSRDSIRVVVRQRAARVVAVSDSIRGVAGRSWTAQAQVFDADGNLFSSSSLSWRSADPTVATIDQETRVIRFLQAGSTFVYAEAPSGARDSILVAVDPMPKLRLPVRSMSLTTTMRGNGVHMNVEGQWTGGVMTFRTLDPSIAIVETINVQSWGAVVTLAGRGAGTTMLVATAPGTTPDTIPIHVHQAQLSISSAALAANDDLELVAGIDEYVGIVALDSAGRNVTQSITVPLTIEISDLSVVKWRYAYGSAVLYEGTANGILQQLSTVAVGSAFIRVSAPGMKPDSIMITVTPRKRLRFLDGRVQTVAKGFDTRPRPRRIGATDSRGDFGFSYNRPAIPVTLTSLHPDISRVPASVTVLAGQPWVTYVQTGVALGIDTIIATAPGYDPDTAIVIVTTPKIATIFPAMPIKPGAFGQLFVTDSLDTPNTAVAATTFSLSSSNPAVFSPKSVLLEASNTSAYVNSLALDSGTTTITIAAAARGVVPRSELVRAVLDSSLGFMNMYEDSLTMAIGTRQSWTDSNWWITRVGGGTGAAVVTLRSTDPSILRVQASVTMAGTYEIFQAGGGDRPGVARIIASAKGYADAFSRPIEVGRSKFRLLGPATAYVGGTGYSVAARTLDHRLRPRPNDDEIHAVVSGIESGVVASGGLVIPARAGFSQNTGISFTEAGRRRVVVSDSRSGPIAYESDTIAVNVRLPWVSIGSSGGFNLKEFYTSSFVGVGVGQLVRVNVGRPSNVIAHDVTATVERRGSRSISESSVTIAAGSNASPYTITGRAVGTDTLVFAAPGYESRRALVYVTEGTILLGVPPRLRANSSFPSELLIADAGGYPGTAAVPVTFRVSVTGPIQLLRDGVPVTTLTVPAGERGLSGLTIVGNAPGTGTIEITNVNYEPFKTSIVIYPPE